MRWVLVILLAMSVAASESSAIGLLNQKTSFGELLIAELTPQVQISFAYNINADFIDTTVANGGAVTAANSMAVLTTSTNSAGSSRITSRRVLRYGPGQGGLVRFTTVFSKCVAGSTQIIGLGDSVDGYFIGCNGVEFGFLRRVGSTDNWTAQDDWVSTQPSGRYGVEIAPVMKNDITKGNVWQIRYQWLGFGEITLYVEDQASGQFVLVHRVLYSDSETTPSIMNPTLPLLAEVVNAGNTTNVTLKTSSMFAGIEGREPDIGTRNGASRIYTSTTSEVPILTIRSRSTFASIANRVQSLVDFVVITSDSVGLIQFNFVINAVLTGSSFSDIATNTSTMEVDTSAGSYTGGQLLAPILMATAGTVVLPFADLNLRLNSGESLTVTVQKLAGANGVTGTSISWKELF